MNWSNVSDSPIQFSNYFLSTYFVVGPADAHLKLSNAWPLPPRPMLYALCLICGWTTELEMKLLCPFIPIMCVQTQCLRKRQGTFPVAQWLRIRLPMQGTRVRSLVREDPTCRGATKPECRNYWACVLQLLKPTRLEPVLHNKRSHHSEKPTHCNEE